VSSGLIASERLMGVAIAILTVLGRLE